MMVSLFLMVVPEDPPSSFLIFCGGLPDPVFEAGGETRAGASLALELAPVSAPRMTGGRLSEAPLCSRIPEASRLG